MNQSFYLGFIQLRSFPHGVSLLTGRYDSKNVTRELSRLKALAAALSGTVGLGNVAGVGIAIATGGPGSIFWIT